MDKHAKFPPSGASVWLNCHAFVRWASKFYKRPSGQAALDGTALHEEAAHCLIKGKRPENPKLKTYVGTVLNTWELHGGELWIEEKIQVPKVEKMVWGTLDAAIVTRNRKWVFDYKSGHGPVSAAENKQLMTYAVGLPRRKDVTLVICQRNEKPDVWRTDGDRIAIHHENILVAVQEAMRPRPYAVPGKWCEWCRAKMFCKAFLTKKPVEVEI